MVTSQEIRLFALECLRWADEADDAGHRDLMRRVARTWTRTASALDRRQGIDGDVLPDLRGKLD
jgi:hypothetical protein